jgi:hypothetical protein
LVLLAASIYLLRQDVIRASLCGQARTVDLFSIRRRAF